MNSENVYVIFNAPFENSQFLSLDDEQNCNYFSLTSSDVSITISKNEVLNADNITDYVFQALQKVLSKDKKNFIVHPGSHEEELTFMLNILSWSVQILQMKYTINTKGYEEDEPIVFTKIKHINDVKENVLYLQIACVFKNFYMDVYNNNIYSCYIIEEFSATEISSLDHLETVILKYAKCIPFKSHTVIYSLFFKCKNPINNKYECPRFSFVEIRSIDHFAECVEEIDQPRVLTLARTEMKKVLIEISAQIEDMCAFINIHYQQPYQSEHVAKLIAELVKKDAIPFNYEMFSEEIKDIKSRHKYIEQKYKYLKSRYERDLEDIRKSTARELVDKLSASHNELLTNQRNKYEQLIDENNTSQEKKIQSLTNYYEKKVEDLQKEIKENKNAEIKDMKKLVDIEKLNKNLEEQKIDLEKQLILYESKLHNIQNLISGIPVNTTAGNLYKNSPQSKLHATLLKKNCQTPVKTETSITSTESENNENKLEIKLKAAEQEIEDMKQKLKFVEGLNEKLQFQINYMNEYKRHDESTIKSLMEKNVRIAQDLENMKERHNEQFLKYEKIIKKNHQEIDIQKREVNVLRKHLLSDNFYPQTPPVMLLRQQSTEQSNTDKEVTPSLRIDSTIETPTTLDQITSQLCTTSLSTNGEENDYEKTPTEIKTPRGRPARRGRGRGRPNVKK